MPLRFGKLSLSSWKTGVFHLRVQFNLLHNSFHGRGKLYLLVSAVKIKILTYIIAAIRFKSLKTLGDFLWRQNIFYQKYILLLRFRAKRICLGSLIENVCTGWWVSKIRKAFFAKSFSPNYKVLCRVSVFRYIRIQPKIFKINVRRILFHLHSSKNYFAIYVFFLGLFILV